jgi:hypothetical protein
MFVWIFIGDITHEGQFFSPCFSIFFQPRSRNVFLLKYSWLNHYTMTIQNHWHQYGCTLYVEGTTHTTYVGRQDHIKHVGDMLNSTMCKASVVHWWEISARVQDDVKMFNHKPNEKDILMAFYLSNFPMMASSNVKERSKLSW